MYKKKDYINKIRKKLLDIALKFGTFTLHSDQVSYFYFDILKVITDEEFANNFINYISDEVEYLVGIEFGGALLAALSGKPFSIIRKDNNIYGKIPRNYSLIDDVTTTENNLQSAISIIGHKPTKIITIVDRRELNERSLIIQSLLDMRNQ